jgi:lipopolysaccharide/colanic/teichoic acid biosynthesis glycosyltransferase
MAKWLEDKVTAALRLSVALPSLLLISLATKLDIPGSAPRAGADNPFRVGAGG